MFTIMFTWLCRWLHCIHIRNPGPLSSLFKGFFIYILPPASTITTQAGGNVSFQCQGTTLSFFISPSTTTTTHRRNIQVYAEHCIPPEGVCNVTFTIVNVTVEDSGEYMCTNTSQRYILIVSAGKRANW